MKKFEQFKLHNLEDVAVMSETGKDVFTGFVFYDAKLGIVSFGVEQNSGYSAYALGVPEYKFLDFDCKVGVETAELAVRDFADRTAKAKTFHEKELARLRLEVMLKGYIKPMASEKEASAI